MHRAVKPSAFQGARASPVQNPKGRCARVPEFAETTLQGFFWWTGFHYLKERLYYPVKLNFHHIKLSQGEPRIGAFMVFGFFC